MTNINFNNSVQALNFNNSVSPALNSSYYNFAPGAVLPSANLTPYLSFNRSTGISSGVTYTFTTTFSLAEITFTITINLTGTVTSSNFTIAVSATDGNGQTQTTGTLTDAGTAYFFVFLGTPSGVAMYYTLTISRFKTSGYDDVNIALSPGSQTNNQNIDLKPYDGKSPIHLLDVWGEGRLACGDPISGFTQSYNVNVLTVPSSCVPQVPTIPNRIGVTEYDNPVFPIPSGVVQFVTCMNSGITAGTAKEMCRVLNPTTGVVILFGYEMNLPSDSKNVYAFEANMGNLIFKPNDVLLPPFDQITTKPLNTPARIYGFPGARDKVEL